ncbi:MAG TPA: histidine phosphatase family protein [Telluria sp.]|jgi:phosphohistidine phosphatase
MDLILWRHADAEDGEPDMARKLSSKGQRQAKRMARWLHNHLPRDVRILCSPAERARQTADTLHLKYHVVDELAPACGVDQLLKASAWPQGDEVVVLVGHNPAISQLASKILSSKAFPMYMRKGSILWFTSRTREDEPDVVLKAAMVPSMLKRG